MDNGTRLSREPLNVPGVSEFDPDLRRVAVHADSASVDLTLPATVPVAELIPSIVDALGGVTPGTRYHLARLGAAPLPNSTTLRQIGIRDGTALVLSRQAPAPPAIRYDDAADAVSAALGSPTQSWQPMTAALAAVCFAATAALALLRAASGAARHSDTAAATAAATALAIVVMTGVIPPIRRNPIAGLTLSLIATAAAAIAGLLAVPGAPGAPNALLAAMAAGATAALALRVTRCSPVVLGAVVCCAATVAVAAALASTLTAAPPHIVGSAAALACLGLIEVAPRASIRLAGLAPGADQDDPLPESGLAAHAQRADSVLTILRAGLAVAAALGAVIAALAAPRAVVLAAVTGGVLVVHARIDRRRGLVFAAAGITTLATTLAMAALGPPAQAPWVAGLAAVAAATAIYLGFVAPAVTVSPVTRRGVQALGCIALTLVAPVACWTSGAFDAVRGLNLLRT